MKFEGLKFADLHISEICGFAIENLKKHLPGHLCKFATSVNDTFGNFLNKFEIALTRYSGAWGKLIHEKKPEIKNLVALFL
jgi:hypothetical protein